MKILGIDPGLNYTGWAVISASKSSISLIDFGIITPNAKHPTSNRLKQIYEILKERIIEYNPDHVAIEETFVNKDPKSALKLGYARGVALMVPSIFDLPVFEYAPTTIKKTVTGNGHASKEQVEAMIKIVMPKSYNIITEAKDDAVDAIAIAMCHAYHKRI